MQFSMHYRERHLHQTVPLQPAEELRSQAVPGGEEEHQEEDRLDCVSVSELLRYYGGTSAYPQCRLPVAPGLRRNASPRTQATLAPFSRTAVCLPKTVSKSTKPSQKGVFHSGGGVSPSNPFRACGGLESTDRLVICLQVTD